MPRVMEITTPLDDGVLLFQAISAREELGRLFEYRIEVLSERNDIDPNKLLGKNVTVKVELPDGSTRHFDAFVTRFAFAGVQGRYLRYRITGRPWLWFLTRCADCRIFQNKKVPEIIEEIFGKYANAAFQLDKLTGTYQPSEYCVQYRETDFDFVSRLMEQEGIYYSFTHKAGKHTLVLADSPSAHEPFPGYEELPFVSGERAVRIEQERVSEWGFSWEVQPGAYAIDDFDFKKPSVELLQQTRHKRDYAEAEHEIYDYPGEYETKDEGEAYVRIRLEELQSQVQVMHGAGNARGIAVGSVFKLADQPREDQNRKYLITASTLDFVLNAYETGQGEGATFHASFDCIASDVPFRPQRTTRKPLVQGLQTAIVVGPAGDEIYTDEYGRVKVHFHWDRYGKEDENDSCWIRVCHPWAGKGWGSVAIPRIGQEVVVEFLEGDPNRPLITGRVYNAEQMPPFGLPAGAVISGLKSNTHKGSGYNEMSMDDTAGKEKITIHGQYDMNSTIEHDQTTTVHNSRTDTIDVDDSETVGNNQTQSIGVDQTITIGANRTESVGASETITVTGHRTETVNGGETVTVTGGRSHTVNGVQTTTISVAEMHSVGAGRMHNVGAGEAISVGGAQAVNVGAVQTVSVGGAQMVNIGALQSVNVAGPHKLSAAAVSETSKGPFKIKAAGICMIEAPTIVLKAGGSKITMNSSGITIKGAKITIKADGSASMTAGGSIKIKGTNLGED